MTRFKGNVHDVYELDADFIHENSTLTKTVEEPSEHYHGSNISWSSSENINIESPEVEEIYNTAIYRKNISIYGYALFKGLITKYNRSLYGYSQNKSYMYANVSGVTTNTGVFFLLPASDLYYSGVLQIRITVCSMDVSKVEEDFAPDKDRTFVVDPKGETTVVRNVITNKSAKFIVKPSGETTIAPTQTTTSKEFIRAKKSKNIGGLYIKRTTTKNLS